MKSAFQGGAPFPTGNRIRAGFPRVDPHHPLSVGLQSFVWLGLVDIGSISWPFTQQNARAGVYNVNAFGPAGFFDTSNEPEFFRAGSASPYNLSGSYTIEARISFHTASSINGICSIYEHNTANEKCYFFINTSNVLRAGFYNEATGAQQDVTGGTALTTGRVYDLVAVFDADAATLTTYIDGVQEAQTTGVVSVPRNSGANQNWKLVAGSYTYTTGTTRLNYLRIWNRALAPAEISGLYSAPFANIAFPTDFFMAPYIGEPTPPAGTLLAQLGAITLSSTGTIAGAGTLDVTLGSVTLAATSLVTNTGSLAVTLDSIEVSDSTGRIPVIPLGEIVLAATATLAIAGTLAATLGDITVAATGLLPIEGQVKKTLGGIGLEATGALAIQGSLAATLGPVTLAATDSDKMFFFAWSAAGDGFSGAMVREDEHVFAFKIEHSEGDFPTLRIQLVNPRVGLLGAGRNLWCWFSWRNGSTIEPLFHGRLVGTPSRADGEAVELQFVARPDNYVTIKRALAETLKVRPYWDPVWLAEGVDDPDTAWEARPEAVHIDRVSLAVTSSNIIIGEDGTLTLGAGDHFYDAFDVTYGETPLRQVKVKATVTWQQQGTGTVDLTQKLVDAFREAGSPVEYPLVSTFTGDGFESDWPQPEATIGAGWAVGLGSSITEATWIPPQFKTVVWLRPTYTTEEVVDVAGKFQYFGSRGGWRWKPAKTHDEQILTGWETWAVIFPLFSYAVSLPADYVADRARTETVSFTLAADIQPLLVDPDDDEEEDLELASDFVAQAVDPDGAMPIQDLRRNAYFPTDRGVQSLENLIMMARARILSRARAVSVTVGVPFETATALSCRKNVFVTDDRLPDGGAAGKVTNYKLRGNGDTGEIDAEVTIGCTIGYGNTVSASAGTNVYIDDYIDGYFAMEGAVLDPGPGDITYETLDFAVIDDDGVDLFNMTADRVIQSLSITDGPQDQLDALDEVFLAYKPNPLIPVPPDASYTPPYDDTTDPPGVLKEHPTVVSLSLVPITGRSFQTDYAPVVSALMVPKTVDLEAA